MGAPILALLWILGWLDTGSPLFKQERVGRHQKSFTLVKFRTMRPDTQSVATHLANPAAVTPLGAFLRRTKLDELPQLWNVLKGEMSIVGPRPMMPEQRALYPGRAYYDMRPGLTGPWQISDRNDVSFAGRADFDADYAGRMSLGADLGIIFLTVWVVLRGTGY